VSRPLVELQALGSKLAFRPADSGIIRVASLIADAGLVIATTVVLTAGIQIVPIYATFSDGPVVFACVVASAVVALAVANC